MEIYNIKIIEKKYKTTSLKEEHFLEQLNKCVKNVHKGQPLLLELSGGLDSRFLLELFLNNSLDVRTITYGMELSDEIRFGGLTARLNKVKHDIIFLEAEDFLENANKYIQQTGGIDLFVQSAVYKIFSNYSEDIPRVLETGLGVHTTIGGDYYREDLRLKKLIFQEIPFIKDDVSKFEIEDAFDFAIKHRTLSILMLRQSGHREFHDDRYCMYSYDIWFLIRSIPEEMLRSEKYFYNLGRMVIKNAENVPLRQTLFDMTLPIDFWEEANLIQAKREKMALDVYRKTNIPVYQNRYYSDFDMWLRIHPDWKKMIDDLLLSSDCFLTKRLINPDYVKKCIEEHMKAEKSHMRNIVKWLSLELLFRYYQKHT